MGPLRYISCRTSERNIKKYTNLIKSTTKPGINASNILINEQSMQAFDITQIIQNVNRSNTIRYSPNTFVCHPSGDVNAPQLWEPHQAFESLGEGHICCGLPDVDVVRALESYYVRLFNDRSVVLDSVDVRLAERLWLDSTVISSKMYRKRRQLKTRADNFVMFEAGVHRRYY